MVRFRSGAFEPLAQLRDEMNRLVSGVQWEWPEWGGIPASVFPAVNLWEKDDEFFVEAELPGYRAEDLDISVQGSELTIQGRRTVQAEEQVVYHRQERGNDEFSRTLTLPREVESAGVQASLTDGVLLLRLPRSADARPRKIEVKQT